MLKIIGQQIGPFTVLGRSKFRGSRKPWLVRCKCGREFAARVDVIQKQASCGLKCPLYLASLRSDHTGKRYNALTGVRPIDLLRWLWDCDCGNQHVANAHLVVRGNITSCGCRRKSQNGRWGTLEYRREYEKRTGYRYQNGVRRATPRALAESDIKAMGAIYAEAERLTKQTGIPHNVDHIIPLQGKGVSGLHVPWNLRVITQVENVKKSNKFLDELC